MSVDIIKLLPDTVANQIAAGEVVQRPASVVKELLENAIDAKASRIQLIVKDAGRSVIQVIDNGIGMSPTDARMSFERHATSKIRETADIFNIQTKGFRGEALASIAAVAQVVLKTKRAEDTMGHQLKIEGSVVKEAQTVTSNTGTIITVKNLFYNVPARRNFLKSNSLEFKHILDEFQRIAFVHPEVSMSLHHNEQEIYQLQQSNFKQRIVAIMGNKYNDKLVPIAEETAVVKIKGYILKPEFSKKKRAEQFFFVNHRFIKSQYLHYAILEGFEHLIPQGYHPGYFIQLELDPKHIDINIHPTKTEIKFDDDFTIFTFLRATVKHSLGQYNIAPSLDFELQPDLQVPLLPKERPVIIPQIQVNTHFNPFTKTQPSLKEKTQTAQFYSSFADDFSQPLENPLPFDLDQSSGLSDSPMMQWKEKYLLLQDKNGLMIIDQYRAHKRILYDTYLNQMQQVHSLSQQLLFTLRIACSASEFIHIQELEKTLFILGFDFDYHSDNIIEIKALPANMQPEEVNIFLQHLFMQDLTMAIENKQHFIALSLAKAAAIKRGTKLNQTAQKDLVTQLFKTTNPNYSPEGKKIFVHLITEDLEKQFL